MLVLLSFGQYLERLFRAYQQAGTISSGYLRLRAALFRRAARSSVASPTSRAAATIRSYASIGASGAVSAVIFTSIFFNPWSKIYFFGILPIPGILFGVAIRRVRTVPEPASGRRQRQPQRPSVGRAVRLCLSPAARAFAVACVLIRNLTAVLTAPMKSVCLNGTFVEPAEAGRSAVDAGKESPLPTHSYVRRHGSLSFRTPRNPDPRPRPFVRHANRPVREPDRRPDRPTARNQPVSGGDKAPA